MGRPSTPRALREQLLKTVTFIMFSMMTMLFLILPRHIVTLTKLSSYTRIFPWKKEARIEFRNVMFLFITTGHDVK